MATKKQLRLLLWDDCNRSCVGCCNKEWDTKALEVCTDYTPYDVIMLTGGEPLMYPDRLMTIIKDIRAKSNAKIYVYTALTGERDLLKVLKMVDGLTVTLHGEGAVATFLYFDLQLQKADIEGKSLRLNVFKGVWFPYPAAGWAVQHIKWIKDCPLPKNEVFMRLETK